jgi:hypothetical protein
MPARRFPPTWSIDELEACFVVVDGAGQKLAYVHFEEEPGLALAGQAAHKGRGATDRGQHRQAAGVVG